MEAEGEEDNEGLFEQVCANFDGVSVGFSGIRLKSLQDQSSRDIKCAE